MVRSIHRTKILFVVAASLLAPASILSSVHAANPESLDFQVNIAEALTITVTNPTSWAKGGLTNTASGGKVESDFLRNKVSVSATSNNPIGVTVSMYTKGGTDLRNTTSYNASDASTSIPTLTANYAVSNFPTNYWGYSANHDTNGDTDAGSTSAVYKPLSTSAIQLFSTIGTGSNTGSEDVYFGAKANNDKQSGTYARTVYFAAVTGNINTDPTDPNYNPLIPDPSTNPPSTPDPVDNYAHYTSTTGRTTYTTRTTTSATGADATDSVTGDMNNTTTDVTAGDVSTTYAQAYGVTNSSTGSALGVALGVAASVSAASGFFFFILAKRRKDDDEEEEEEGT